MKIDVDYKFPGWPQKTTTLNVTGRWLGMAVKGGALVALVLFCAVIGAPTWYTAAVAGLILLL